MTTMRLTLTSDPSNPVVGDLYLGETGQLEFVGATTDMADRALDVLQRVRSRLLLIRGEWYLDQRQGTPWREAVFSRGVTEDVVRRMVRAAALATPGVSSVERVEATIDKATRLATVRLEVTTDEGQRVTSDDLDNPFIVEVPRV